MSDPVALLARADKWFLSAGDGIAFAPPFPQWLDLPGFWDEATLHHYAFAPLFTVSAVDADGREVTMRAVARRWTPAELTVDYRLSNGMMASEVRTVQPGGIFASEWLVQGLRESSINLIAWTVREAAGVDRSSVRYDGALGFQATILDEQGESLPVHAELASYGESTSWAAYFTSRTTMAPRWELTPFPEKWSADGLPCEVRLEGQADDAMLFGAMHRTLDVTGDGASITFAMRLTPEQLPRCRPATPANGARVVTPERNIAMPPHAATLAGASRRRWAEWFAQVPEFRCSDPYFERAYWYRWYGLRFNALEVDAGAIPAPALCEGNSELHTPSALAAPAQVRELRWMRSPHFARGAMRAFFAHQRADGSTPARLYADHRSDVAVVQSNWGDAIIAIDAVWPDDDFLREMYTPLSRYADWLLASRDEPGCGVIAIASPSEIGERHSSRFEAVNPGGSDHEGASARLAGIDATTHAYTLARALETIALKLGHPPDARRWRLARERIADAVRNRMWDSEDEMFFDLDMRSGSRTRVKTAHSFFPYATDLATTHHLRGFERHLLDPAEFWTPFPVPVTSVDDPFFSAYGEWKGQRQSHPWNGRVRPSVNSQVMEALGCVARTIAPALRQEAASFLSRYVHMMFHDGDPHRPNSVEHYNPLTGRAGVHRGIEDVQQSWIADHIVTFVMGVEPREGGITIDPLPLGLERADISGVGVRGRDVGVRIVGDRVTATVDGQSYETVIGRRLEIEG